MSHSKPAQHLWNRDDFRKSSYSNGGAAGNCVAIAKRRHTYAIADTKLPLTNSNSLMTVDIDDAQALLRQVKHPT